MDDQNKEVTMQMDVENLNIEDNKEETTEIFFVIDNSGSMGAPVDMGQTRQSILNKSAKDLAKSILNSKSNIKIGVVQFDEASYKISDAKMETKPTNVLGEIEKAIDNIKATTGGTDIDAGLQVAKNNFTSGKNQIIILLTDGAPIACVGYVDTEKEVIENTKKTLQSVIDSKIDLITVLTQVNDSYPYVDGLTEKNIVDQIFGTQQAPNYGKFYYISDNDIEKTILNDVYENVKDIISSDIIDINIIDYFPNDIIENYDIEIIEEPNIGNANLLNNTLTWNIEILKTGEKSSLKYKLKLKENYKDSIINVETPTNEKVDIKYTNKDNIIETETSNTSPSIILKKEETINDTVNNVSINEISANEVTTNIIVDNTTAPTPLPNTGVNEHTFKIIMINIIIIVILAYVIYAKYYRDI